MCLKTVQTTIMLHIQSSLPCFHSAGNKMVAALVLEHPQLQLNSWSMFLKAFLGRNIQFSDRIWVQRTDHRSALLKQSWWKICKLPHLTGVLLQEGNCGDDASSCGGTVRSLPLSSHLSFTVQFCCPLFCFLCGGAVTARHVAAW